MNSSVAPEDPVVGEFLLDKILEQIILLVRCGALDHRARLHSLWISKAKERISQRISNLLAMASNLLARAP